jgi:signal transduction histidine kinase
MAAGGERGTVESWYRAIKARSARATGMGASALSIGIALSEWGHWFAFGVAIFLGISMVPINLLFDRYVAARLGSKGEVYRALMNNLVCIPLFNIMGWPIAVWFWLPFSALTLDAGNSRQGLRGVVVICLVQVLGGIWGGVDMSVPLLFCLLTVVCWSITNQRTQYIRALADDASAQRDATARAHAELAGAHEQLLRETAARQKAEADLLHGEKFEAIGRLAAGVAHEINTPMQFISDNLEFISDAAGELIALAQKCASDIEKADADLDYLSDHMPTALAQAQQGMIRVARIVRSMKELAHPGDAEVAPVDLNHVITNALVISTYQYKLVADVETELGELALIDANADELSQVLLNLVVNAADAVSDVYAETGRRGKIEIRSFEDQGAVVVRIRDTGAGIPADIQSKIFEPFFTTKSVGRGTGQGLAICRAFIERVGGELTFHSTSGVGTTFQIRLPINGTKLANAA